MDQRSDYKLQSWEWYLPDDALLALYSFWSEEYHTASFLTPTPGSVYEFRQWLDGMGQERKPPYKDYEQEFLREYQLQKQNTK